MILVSGINRSRLKMIDHICFSVDVEVEAKQENGGKSSAFTLRTPRFASKNKSSCSYDFPQGQEILTLEKQCHARRIEQSIVDQAINDICILLQCSRHNINVVGICWERVSSSYLKNLENLLFYHVSMVMGWLRFLESGAKFDCINSPNDAHPIPTFVEKVKGILTIDYIVSTANYILVVEKESVFHRLANDQYCTRNRCIVITGRGYPDISTRRFLRLLIEKLRLPTFCLVDCDPYGFDILTTYRFGSMQMAYDAKFLRIPEMHWLGAFPSDFEKYGLPKNCRLKLTAEGEADIREKLKPCYIGATCKEKFHTGGVYSVVIDAEKGTVNVSGKVNPNTILRILDKNGRHAEFSCLEFHGQVEKNNYVENDHCYYYGDHGYIPPRVPVPYSSYPMLGPEFSYYERYPPFLPPPPPPLPPLPPRPPPPRPPPPAVSETSSAAPQAKAATPSQKSKCCTIM
ncbi:Meiotic recombination protein SPO11-1 [Citrus sinensis]|uniref:Meiotic recombination protein SPO11-1 n=1 Tax=Citrus sinensis TaxID=2711 RepID=A0ACB8P350_CITSI|nr:Meiotic recombination protein SPO11-1 [Citrus sinensis]